jgi:RuvB-like protein 1 (pontin 52)
MIVKTDGYNREQIGKVVQLRAQVEGLRLGAGVLNKLAADGERSSLRFASPPLLLPKYVSSWPRSVFVFLFFVVRYALQLLTPASILATLAGRSQIEVEDIGEMNELFLDAKASAGLIGSDGGFNGGNEWS